MHGDLAQYVEELYEEHYGSLYRYMVLCGCRPADADDLVQEGFLRLFRFLRQGHRVTKPRSWLLRVLHNLQIDQHRREQRQIACSDSDLEKRLTDAAGKASNPEAESLRAERMERLERAVEELPPRQYEYLMLRASGMKLREIAGLHGVTLQTVAEACARATERLGRLSHE